LPPHAKFEGDRARSKPISFYNWTPELRQVWQFYRFLQHEFGPGDLEVPRAIAAVLESEPRLLDRYRAIVQLYATLTNPSICLPVDALIAANDDLSELATGQGARRASVAVFPPSTSRETELFDRVFGMALPTNANLMARLIQSIRSGEVNLAPGENDGWYQYQVYALETFLLPGKGQEGEKLLLTARYKKRLVEAFKALMTKRRETHARQLDVAATCAAPPEDVSPRLRIEPCATFYLRTARAYAFLQDFLLATVGEDRLGRLKGLRKDGYRQLGLAEELAAFRQRFYGFYLVSCEDVGMRPEFLEGEPVDQDSAKAAAIAWLGDFADDPDLACDTRVAVPILIDPMRGKARLWATLGVRLARLEASYARPPKIRPKEEGGPWQDVDSYQLGNSSYVIPVDEFAEIEVDGSNVPTRDELRAACDQHKTREAIVEALSQ